MNNVSGSFINNLSNRLSSYEVSSFVKAAAIITALGLGAIALIIHFQGINCIAVYSTAGAGGALILGSALHSVIKRCRREDEKPLIGPRQFVVSQGAIYYYPLTDGELEVLSEFNEGIQAFHADQISRVYCPKGTTTRKDGTRLEGWQKQADISAVTGHATPGSISPLQQNTETHMGKFIFALPFSNCYNELKPDPNDSYAHPPIYMPDPLSPDTAAIEFPNVECYFQYYKSALHIASLSNVFGERDRKTLALRNLIREDRFRNPNNCYSIGRLYQLTSAQRAIWDNVKTDVMTAALYAQFSQYPLLGEMLKATEGCTPIQLKTNAEWGPGRNGTGKNLLGVCLTDVRSALLTNQQLHVPIGNKLYELPKALPRPADMDGSL